MDTEKKQTDLITAGFAHPANCRDLQNSGVKGNTIYTWRICDELTTLNTFIFDISDFYKESEALAYPNALYIPAYRGEELQLLFENYRVNKYSQGNGSIFKLTIDDFNIILMNKRLPDLFIIAVIKLIADGIWHVDYVNMRFKTLGIHFFD